MRKLEYQHLRGMPTMDRQDSKTLQVLTVVLRFQHLVFEFRLKPRQVRVQPSYVLVNLTINNHCRYVVSMEQITFQHCKLYWNVIQQNVTNFTDMSANSDVKAENFPGKCISIFLENFHLYKIYWSEVLLSFKTSKLCLLDLFSIFPTVL